MSHILVILQTNESANKSMFNLLWMLGLLRNSLKIGCAKEWGKTIQHNHSARYGKDFRTPSRQQPTLLVGLSVVAGMMPNAFVQLHCVVCSLCSCMSSISILIIVYMILYILFRIVVK